LHKKIEKSARKTGLHGINIFGDVRHLGDKMCG
jgi:hypothetical protein